MGGARIDFALPHRQGVAIEQAPEIWWQAIVAVCAQLRTRLDLTRVAALAIDGTSATLLLAGADGRPLGSALMYHDARAVEEARLIDQFAPAECAARGATSALAKLLWLGRQPRACEARYALHQADWLSAQCSGKYGFSDENNALKLGYDPLQHLWPAWLEELLEPPQRAWLPQVVPPGTPLARVTPFCVQQLGLSPATWVVAGTTDSTAGVIATGAAQSGEAVTSLGSTLVIKIITPHPVCAPTYGLYSHRFGALWLAGGASNSGGAVLQHYFSTADLERLTPLLQPQCSTGLDYYPLLSPGERFPHADPTFPPRLTPRPAEDSVFLQGILEGLARIEALGYQRLQSVGAPPLRSVRTVGGGAHNSAWTQIRARALGVPLLAPRHHEAAYGAAWLAREAMVSARAI